MAIGLRRYAMARLAMLSIALLMTFMLGAGQPARSDSDTTRVILTSLATTAAVILYNNYLNRQYGYANGQYGYLSPGTAVGTTRDGGVVFADGRIVYPDGTVLYASNDGRAVCTFDGIGVRCGRHVHAFRGFLKHFRKHFRQGDQGEDEDDNDD